MWFGGLFVLLCGLSWVEANKGCVQLDTYSFDKIVSKFQAALIKFDTLYPYGPKHEAYEDVCEASSSSPDLIVGEVQVRDYGEKDNEDIARRFGLGKDDFPAVLLFIKGNNDPIAFKVTDDSEWTTSNIKIWVRSKSGVYIGLPGCLEEFDKLAMEFISSPDKRKELLNEAETTWNKVMGHRENLSAEMYIKVMRRVLDKGAEFVQGETTRLENILKGKLSEEKKMNMQERLNILQSFTNHDEL